MDDFYDVLCAKLPDMDARDTMRGEQLMADFAADRENPGVTENCEIGGSGFLKDRETVFDSDADSLTWEDLDALASRLRNFAHP
eukprot:2423811-Amphidinium_carterae.1